MRGTFTKKNITIFFSFDEIIMDNNLANFVEHKMIDKDSAVEDWYLHFSLIQVAYYSALARKIDKFYTAKFRINQGFEKQTLHIKNNIKRQNTLIFTCDGESVSYNVECLNDKKIIKFYLNKINSTDDYDTAKEWDQKFKFNEWKYLNKYIKYNKI